MVDINPVLSIIALNISGLNAPIKIQKSSEWIKKQDSVMLLQETHFKYTDVYRFNMWRNIYRTYIKQRKTGIAILILEQTSKQRKLSRITKDII